MKCAWRAAARVLAVLACALPAQCQLLDVLTSHGPVRGLYDDQLHMRSFLGIPYGAVQAENRFQAPREPEPWTEVLMADEFTKVCPQMLKDEVVGEEDCLVLNVFAPGEEAGAGEEAAWPVLVHVHGGELQRGGAAPAAYGARRLVPRGLVLVVPNYRLGALGFLCLRAAEAPGNAGLKDLRLALRWVAENIAHFGGDPARVTVSGEGAGGGAAGLLALAPTTAPGVARLIAESGSALSPWILDRTPVERARRFLEDLAPEHDESEGEDADLSYLQELNVSVIVETAHRRNDLFRVCVESTFNNSDSFLTAPPYHLLRAYNNSAGAAAVMIGFASGAGMREAVAQTNESMASLETDYYQLLPVDLTFPSTTNRRNAALSIKSQYFGEEAVNIEHREAYMRYYTDATYLAPALRLARLLAAHGQVFFYEFGFDGALNHAKQSLDTQLPGAARGDLAGYVFPREDEPEPLDEDSARVADLVADLWVSFITHGVPQTTEPSEAWSPLTPDTDAVLNVSTACPRLQRAVHPERLRLWLDLYATNYIDCPNCDVANALTLALLLLTASIVLNNN